MNKMVKKQSWFKEHPIWKWIIIILVILYLLSLYDDGKNEDCDLTFSKYTYSDGCASACSIKCSDMGFQSVSSSYFEPYLSYEEMVDTNLYKRCECNCGGCRE